MFVRHFQWLHKFVWHSSKFSKPLLGSNCSKFILWQHFSVSYLNSHLDCTCERISSVITVIFLTLLGRLFDIEPTSVTSLDCSWWVRDCKTSKSEVDFFVLWTSEESEVSSQPHATTPGMCLFYLTFHKILPVPEAIGIVISARLILAW